MTVPVGVTYGSGCRRVFRRVFGRVLINIDFERMISILSNICKILNIFFKQIIAFYVHIYSEKIDDN